MNRLNFKNVEEFLYKYGWEFTRTEDDTSDKVLWKTGWRSDFRSYPLIITLSQTWILFEVKPLVKFGCKCEIADELCRVAMELNSDMQLAKLSLSEDSELVLSMQFFNNLKYEEFANILGILGYYSDMVSDLLSDLTYEDEDAGFAQFVS